MTIKEKIKQLAEEIQAQENRSNTDLRTAVVLYTLLGALESPPGAIEELSRICEEFSSEMIRQLGMVA